jgi:hypothetical protein
VRPDPDSEEGTSTEAERSYDCNSDKAQCGLVEKVLYDFGAYTVSAFMRISSLWETSDDA